MGVYAPGFMLCLAWGWELERAGCLRGVGVLGEDGMRRGLDCVSCVSDLCPMVCVSARLSPLLLCVFHLLRFVCLVCVSCVSDVGHPCCVMCVCVPLSKICV